MPASTFKVVNLLIALETGTIKDENEIIKWPGSTDTTLYGYRPEIYHDISVKEAFLVSAGWAFIEMAKKIDRKKYQVAFKGIQILRYPTRTATFFQKQLMEFKKMQ